MKKFIFVSLCGLSCFIASSQNVQSDTKATSGGLEAGTTPSGGYGQNVFYGYRAGKVNTTGGANTFVGHYTGFDNTTGMVTLSSEALQDKIIRLDKEMCI